jgi:DivIVA domain-containing protein
MWVFAVLIVLAMGGVAAVAAGRGSPLAPAYDDRPDAAVPAKGTLGPEDLRRVRFSLALRGYRMSEVDALLDRLAREREESGWASTTDPAPDPADPARPSDVDAAFDVDDAVGDAGWRPHPAPGADTRPPDDSRGPAV